MICIKNNSLIITGVVAVVVATVAFFGGMQYQKSKTPANSFFANGGQQGNGQGRRFGNGTGGRNGGAVIGEILSADESSITVKLMDGSSKIVVVSSSTSINKAASASRSDLKKGERVAVFGTTNSDGSVTAQNIQLNPQMRFGGNGPRPTGQPMQ